MHERFTTSEALFLLHFRKCGGTSMRRLMRRVCDRANKEFTAIEGWTLDAAHPLPPAESAYRVTTVRDPIERIKSSYRFEGRWEQEAPTRHPEHAVPFDEWVHQLLARPPSRWLWVCAENYFIKTLIGFPDRGRGSIGRNELDRAKEVLESFDLVLVTSRLSDPATTNLLSDRFGEYVSAPHLKFPTKVDSPDEPDEALFDAATLTELEERNELDTELFRFAEELFESQLAATDRITAAHARPSSLRARVLEHRGLFGRWASRLGRS